MTLNQITSPWWQLSMATEGEVVTDLADINQCIEVIVGTQKGSDPFRPDFGLDLVAYVDLPVNLAIATLRQEIIRQIELWEPRAKVKKVAMKQIEPGGLEISVTWTLNSGGEGGTLVTSITV